jgi:hypothetical protein
MTKREFMEMVIAVANAEDAVITEEMVAFAKNEITKLDERNAKRAGKPSKTAVANEPIKDAIKVFLSDKTAPMTAKEIFEGVEECTSTQKASALCRQMVDNGILTSVDVKVKGKGKQKGYSVA